MSFDPSKKITSLLRCDFGFMSRGRLWCSRKFLFRHWTWQLCRFLFFFGPLLISFFFLFNTSTSCSFVRDNFFFQVIDIKLFTACEELHLVIKSYCTLRYSIQFSLWEKRLYLRGFDFIQPMLNWSSIIWRGK